MGWWVSLPAPLAPHETIQGLSTSVPQKARRGSIVLKPSDRLHRSCGREELESAL
jgi:hypothetical protein